MTTNQSKGKLIGRERLGTYYVIKAWGIGAGVTISIVGIILLLYFAFINPPALNHSASINVALITLLSVGVVIIFIGAYAQCYGIVRTRLKIFDNGFVPYKRSFKDAMRNIEHFVPWKGVRWIEFSDVPRGFQTKKHETYIYEIFWENENGQLKGLHFTCYDFKSTQVSVVLKKLKDVEEKYIKERGLTKPTKLPRVSTGSFC